MSRRRIARTLIAGTILASTLGQGTAGSASDAYFTSENVERIGSIAIDGASAGARIVGKRMYVVSSTGLQIFDVSKPEQPREIGSLALGVGPFRYLQPEDVDTNGEVLVISGLVGKPRADGFDGSELAAPLYVVDVRDPEQPELVAEVPGAGSHTMTCVLDCTYAYGSDGVIVDLTKPSSARVVGNWADSRPAVAAQKHDVTEVRPGVVLTASNPMMLLDARRDAEHPRLVSAAPMPEHVLVHGTEWPRAGRDRVLLVGGETDSAGPCEELEKGELLTVDASRWGRRGGLKVVDEYRPASGVFTDGGRPINTACGHWFDPHPDFSNGGSVALAWYEHGVRFLNVTPTGQIEEVGYFVPVDGSTSAAYWVTDDIVYATDYNLRGIDILRVSS